MGRIIAFLVPVFVLLYVYRKRRTERGAEMGITSGKASTPISTAWEEAEVRGLKRLPQS